MTANSLFCTLGAGRIVLANELAVVIRDSFPVSPGHTLAIPKRHVGSFLDITGDERDAMLDLLDPEFLAWHRAEVFKEPARE